MSNKRRKRGLHSAQPAVSEKLPRRYGWLYSFAFGSMFSGVVVFAVTRSSVSESSQAAATADGLRLPTLGELTEMSADELQRQDIALLNLRCAEGLPGAENLDIPKCLATLDRWAAWVKHETDRHLYKFRQNTKEYENSEAYFRMLMLITVLQQDCKIHYNENRIRDVDFTKSQDLFIHGMIASDNGGTCVSMPVLYTAIARRLGYPVYLVTAKAHVFCRWHDKKDYVNCEATSQGLSMFDDDHYMKWPKPISEDEVKAGHYLKSLSPGEELAVFLSARGHCLEDIGRRPEALVSYAQALQRRPDSPDYFAFLANSMGFRQRPVLPQVARRQLVEPPMVYPTAHDPYTYSRPTRNSGIGWAQPTVPTQQHNVFKPYALRTGLPNGFQNPVADPGFGFPQ
jgi:hypothetical protein